MSCCRVSRGSDAVQDARSRAASYRHGARCAKRRDEGTHYPLSAGLLLLAYCCCLRQVWSELVKQMEKQNLQVLRCLRSLCLLTVSSHQWREEMTTVINYQVLRTLTCYSASAIQ